MKVNKEELIQVLIRLQPALTKDALVEESDHFIFTEDSIAAYNDRICVLHKFEAGIKGSVPNSEFFDLVKEMPADKKGEIDLSIVKRDIDVVIDGEKTKAPVKHLMIKSRDVRDKKKGETEAVIHLSIDESIFDIIKQVDEQSKDLEFNYLPEDFMKGMKLCLPDALRSSVDFSIKNCLYAHGRDIFCTDGARISWYRCDEELDEEILALAESLEGLLKTGVTFDVYKVTESWIHFMDKNEVMFSLRRNEGEFLNCEKVFKSIEEQTGVEITLPLDLAENIAMIMPMSEGGIASDMSMDITLTKGKLILRTEKDRGWAVRKVDFDYDGEEIKFSINPNFLTTSANLTPVVKIYDTMLLFEAGNFKHLVGKRVLG